MLYEETLVQAGFTKDQATIYLALLKQGNTTAKKLIAHTGLKRGLLYKVLDQLLALQLIEKLERDGSITRFKPRHPAEILDKLEQKRLEVKTATESVRAIVGKLSSDFNLISGKPNVQFFEGIDGVRSVLEDSLYAKEEIYSYADLESIETHIKDVNEWYVKERAKLGIKKRGLVLDTAFNRSFLQNYFKEVTDTRLLTLGSTPFATIMQMYDDKVSYITLGDTMIGIIITNPHICEMHRKLFAFNWEQSKLLVPSVDSKIDNA
jgi:HTH-type transcriptional regulator, sugar sensing transcriptional regulator